MAKERNRGKKWGLVVIVGIIILLIYSIMTSRFYELFNSALHSEPKVDNKIEYNDYIYKIRYDFGAESYIYLLKDKSIKVVTVTPVYETCEGMNCMDFTGKYDYSEETVSFSSEIMDEVISVFNDLYKISGKKDFNADDYDLTEYQQKVLLAVTLGSEDDITIERNIEFEQVKEELKNQNGSVVLTNKKTVMKNDTPNKIVNSIADYLNRIIDAGFVEDREEIRGVSKDMSSEDLTYIGPLYADRTLTLEHVGLYSISFKYVYEGQLLGPQAIYEPKGYVFDYTGKTKEIPGGLKDGLYDSAIQEFMKSELYNEFSGELDENWKSKFRNQMFEIGNWYTTEGKIVFLIEGTSLGLSRAVRVFDIEVALDESF